MLMRAGNGVVFTILACALALACAAPGRPAGAETASSAPTAAPAPRQLTIGISSADSSATLWVARDAGFFARYGLDADVPYLSGVKAVQSLVAHQIEYGLISGRTTSDAHLAGADMVLLAGLSTTLSFILFGTPGLSPPPDLRGKTISIHQFGAPADFAPPP